MANLLFKRNNNQGVAPSVSELELGELALNTYDGTIYTKVDRAGAQSIVAIPNGDGAFQTGVLYVSKNGDDTNSGKTPGTAKLTIASAVAVANENVFAPTTPAPAGYSSAVALLKANKTYLQSEATAYVNSVYSNLTYDETKCYRDVGLIIDAITTDLKFDGNEESIFAARSYLTYLGNNLGSVSETNATIAAIYYIKTISRSVIQNSTVISSYQSTVTQTINNSLTGGVAADAKMGELYDTITNGIQNGEDDLAAIDVNDIVIEPQTITISSISFLNST